ncbi:MAG: hypothetical protein GXP28_11985, partial [Planctomycetes bacterium]|nr:hypothetical protein [Planctomycetota bacterium]
GELDGKIDEMAEANMRLFEMNQLKSDFLATISHELRTPLNSILGFSDLLGSIDRLDEKELRYAHNIQTSGRQLLEMINDILDLAKIESGKMKVRPTDFDLGAVVTTQCDMARPLRKEKHRSRLRDRRRFGSDSSGPRKAGADSQQSAFQRDQIYARRRTYHCCRPLRPTRRPAADDLGHGRWDQRIRTSVGVRKIPPRNQRLTGRQRNDARILGHRFGIVDRARTVSIVGRRHHAGKRTGQRKHLHGTFALDVNQTPQTRIAASRRTEADDQIAIRNIGRRTDSQPFKKLSR